MSELKFYIRALMGFKSPGVIIISQYSNNHGNCFSTSMKDKITIMQQKYLSKISTVSCAVVHAERCCNEKCIYKKLPRFWYVILSVFDFECSPVLQDQWICLMRIPPLLSSLLTVLIMKAL